MGYVFGGGEDEMTQLKNNNNQHSAKFYNKRKQFMLKNEPIKRS